MAPLTGAVLSKVLNDYVVDYPNLHPRYQPFSVVEKSSGKAVLNSSNSEDFVWNVIRKLANMYVAIDPILAPKRYTIQLTVEDVKRDVMRLDGNVLMTSYDVQDENGVTHERKQNVANYAADFYYKLYSCMDAIKTGDYSMYHKTLSPSAAPTAGPTFSPTVAPTVQVTVGNYNNTDDTIDDDDNGDEEKDEISLLDAPSPDSTDDEYYMSQPETDGPEDVVRNMKNAKKLSENGDNVDTDSTINGEEGQDKSNGDEDKNVMPFVGDAKLAAEEAEKAAEYAKEAAESTEDVKASEAAELAALAAKKAAQATSEAANEAAMESILSGDGDLMMNVIQTCFSDPKYGIQDASGDKGNETLTVNAFLYLDGSHYYRLNLTAPFVSVETFTQPLPKVSFVPDGKSDVVDVGLAIAIFGAFVFGVIVMLHHIRVLRWDDRLQFKWFFHPSEVRHTKRGGYCDTPNDDDSLSIEETQCDLELSDRQIH
jgi:Membrane protein involved in colicin uptake